ncbi:hybrid sensor histidine kinase/response regulator [Faunimonas pinastri]|uniref:hybrid sensor histidine kinase/response regulator n=1 Tax=Faunimonas pinastri TaxID=1855383 RepID=UPI0015A6117F|nr:PAS domain-containing sensor histidine kinase [Faunimonas pinastri]
MSDATGNEPAEAPTQGRPDVAVCMLDRDGFVVSWSKGGQRFTEQDPDGIVGQPFSALFAERDRQAGLPGTILQKARESHFEGEVLQQRPEGEGFRVRLTVESTRSAGGDVLGFVVVSQDLTAGAAIQESLRQNEEQFRRLVQSVTDYAIYMLDPEGYVSNWNSGAQRIKGYAPEEIVGEHFSRFYTDEDRKNRLPWQGLATAAEAGRFEKEGWRVRKDGSRFWAHVVIDPIRDDDGNLLGFAKVTRDITERMEAQRALEKAREAFFQSQKMEALGQLTGGVAHDFNNLLAAVLGSLELLKKHMPEEPRATRLVNNAIQAAERGATLTQRMLAFARRQELSLEAVEIDALVKGMIELLERSLGPSVTIRANLPSGPLFGKADANQLELAILNLGVNARDAMPDGGLIDIDVREEEGAGVPDALKPGRYICISVADTGEGMDEATLARATEPFFTTKGIGKGTGLGLSMVHGMVEQSGGRLILRSDKGRGTTAELWIPRWSEGAPGQGQVDRALAVEVATKPCTVLAVDDDGLVLLNTTAMLENLGHTVLPASSGRQALNILNERGNVDLVITDHAMPRMTGSELASEIRARSPELPIILTTGYAELPKGANLRLPKLMKPFSEAALARAIADVMNERPAAAAPN